MSKFSCAYPALTLSIQGNFEQAISDIERAIELEPKGVVYKANKGIVLAGQGKFEQAKECIEQAESMKGDRKFIYYAKACFFALQNQEQEAIKNLKEAVAIDPRCKPEAKRNPDFDRLRENTEFNALIASTAARK